MFHTCQSEREVSHWKLSVLVPLLGTQSVRVERAEKEQTVQRNRAED